MYAFHPAMYIQEEKHYTDLNHISAGAEQILWHQRLGHINFRKLSELHKYVDDVPKIAMPSDIDNCMTYWSCKIKRAARGSADTQQDATLIGEGISVDWRFACQRYKTKGRYEKLAGINKETAYLIIVDHATDVLWGFSSDSKRPPIDFLNRWFIQYGPRDARHKYCCMDQGGELAHNKEVNDLVLLHGYVVTPTGGDALHQNDPGERPHQTIGYALRTMLHNNGIPFK
jgi:hypothetical protein